MNIVFFGLTISSAWGNGHATLLRGLFSALHRDGHQITFFERDVPYYAGHRDAPRFDFADLRLYADWEEVQPTAQAALTQADAVIVTSYCPDGAAASHLVLAQRPQLRKIFYDMDTPVTLERLGRGEQVPYLPSSGLAGFDLVLSYTGGAAISQLRSVLGARVAATLYGWVDPATHYSVAPSSNFQADLSYLGTYAADRQAAVEELLFRPARELPGKSFVVAGAMYPDTETWPANVRHFQHVEPAQHPLFYSSSPLTLSTTRGAMAALGYCPSGRLFEAAACRTVVLSDWWTGLDTFFAPGDEILIAASASESSKQIARDRASLRSVAERAYQRTMDCHTAAIRAQRFISLVEDPIDDAEGSEPSSAVPAASDASKLVGELA